MNRTAWIAGLLGIVASLTMLGIVSAAAPPPTGQLEDEGLGLSATALPKPGPAPLRSSDGPELTPGLRVVESGDEAIVLEWVSDGVFVDSVETPDGACDAVTVQGLPAGGRPGWPELPVGVAMIGVPSDAPVAVEVIEVDGVDLPGTYDVCPVGHPVPQRDDGAGIGRPEVRVVRDRAVYATDGLLSERPAEIAGTGYVRSQRVAQVRFHPFQYEPVSGRLRHLRRIRVRVSFGALRQTPDLAAGYVDEGVFEETLRELLVNYDAARAFRADRTTSDGAKTRSLMDGSASYKILVERDGLYALTCDDLHAAGIPTDTLDPATLQVYNRGLEVALQVEGEEDGSCDPGDTVLFYGQAVDTRFTRTNAYLLSWGGGKGKRMATADGSPQGWASPPSYLSTVHIERNTRYRHADPSGPDKDRWYWDLLGATDPLTRAYLIDLPGVATESMSATIQGLLKGYGADPQHHTLAYLNNHLIADEVWEPEAELMITATVPVSYLVEGGNTISVVVPVDMGITADFAFVNWFEVRYQRRYVAVDDVLALSIDDAGAWDVRVTGLPTGTVGVYDITEPMSPVRIVSSTNAISGTAQTITFSASTGGQRRYLALAPSGWLEPVAIRLVDSLDLRATTNGADYMVITHADLVTAAAELAEYRKAEGQRTFVADTDSIYDEFNYGVADPQAIQDFLAYAYASWEAPAPSYVLLLGDGHYDFMDYEGTGEVNVVPPYLADIDPWMGETAADNRYVCVSGEDDLPDMYLGRLTVRTAEDISHALAKITAYEQGAPGADWRRRTMCVADEGEYATGCEELDGDHLPSPYSQEDIYHSITHTGTALIRAAIVAGINEGRLLVGYSGHASTQFWSGDQLFRVQDIASLANEDRFPVMLPMACLEGYYARPSGSSDRSSLGESIVRAAEKGAVASFSPTGYGLPSGHHLMMGTLYDFVFLDGVTELGAATTLAKLSLVGTSYEYLIDNYLLLGDPALDLDVLRASVSITKSVDPTGWVERGEALTYTLAFSNAGPDLTSVQIADELPAGLVDAVAASAGVPITPETGSLFAWVAPELPAGASGRITVAATVSDGFSGWITNTVSISSTALDAELGDNGATVVTTVPHGVFVPLTVRAD